MEESSDDPLTFEAAKETLFPKGRALLEKRTSNPFDVSAGDARNNEENSELSEPSSDPTLLKGREDSFARVERRLFGKGSVPTFPAHKDNNQGTEQQQNQRSRRLAGDLVEDGGIPEDHEEHGPVDLTLIAEAVGVQEADITLRQFEGDGMMLDEEVYYDAPWPAGGEDTLELEPDDPNLHGREDGKNIPPDPLEEEETLQLVHISDEEFEAHTSDDEIAFELKSPEDQEEIKDEIEELLEKMPELAKDYALVDRLGTGTFSSVYKAIDLNCSDWDNQLWQVSHPRSTSTSYSYRRHQDAEQVDTSDISAKKPAYVAIKRILVTSSPRRIINEILIMESCRGCRHVAQIITVHRVEDQIVIVMPYQRSAELKVRSLKSVVSQY
jgi:hypothetical protein